MEKQIWTCAKNEVVDEDQCAFAGGSYCFKECDHHKEPVDAPDAP